MRDFNTRKPEGPNEPNRLGIPLIANKLRTLLIANKFHIQLIENRLRNLFNTSKGRMLLIAHRLRAY
jgi:hypothetical protein